MDVVVNMEKVLLVMGASSDMGVATIKNVESGFDFIIAHYLHMNEELEKVYNSLGDKCILVKADLTVDEDIYRFIETVKSTNHVPTHIIHFPAQQIKIQKFAKTKWENMERGLSISLKSFVLILQTFLPIMSKQKYGKVIVMLSYVLDGMPPKYSADYVMTKYALLGLVKALAVEYADRGITINGISPAFTETKFIEGMLDYFKEENEKASPIGRNLVIEDIIPTIEFMLSEGSNCINGQNISITCGR